MDYIYLAIAGIAGGFFGGLLGIGGGIIYILILPVALRHVGVPDEELIKYVIANSIFATFFSALSSNIAEIKSKRFYKNEVMVVSLLGSISSLFILNFVVYKPWYSVKAFNIVVVVLMVFILITLVYNANPNNKFVREVPFSKRKLGLAGVSGGVVAALSGLGGGTVIVPILNSALNMNIKKAKSISQGFILVTSLFITLFNLLETPNLSFDYFNIGYVVFPVTAPLILGVMLTSPFGVNMSRNLPAYVISYIFAGFILLVMISKLFEIFY